MWAFSCLLGAAPAAAAKPKGAPVPKQASKQTARAIDELQGKFKWGMTVDEVKKLLEDEIRKRHAEEWKKVVGQPAAQDALSAQIRQEIAKIEKSFIRFKGQKTPWEVSIVDREFAHGNEESMMLIEEGQHKQRRFLFFYGDKLYKQFIAFDKELFEGKNFDQFAQIIQNRYGRGQAKYALNRRGEQVLEHLEWPPTGITLLRAVDQSGFYDTFCLVIEDRHVAQTVAPKHKENATAGGGASLVREIQSPEKVSGDANSDIVDRITGRSKAAATSEEPGQLVNEPSKITAPPASAGGSSTSSGAAESAPAPEKKKPAKQQKGKLDDLEL